MRTFYNLFFDLFFVVSAPWYFFRMWRRGGWREGFGQRFGRYDSRLKQKFSNRHTLWFHAVSVGEVNLCTQLIRAIEPHLPTLQIVVSTTTSTGMGELRRRLPAHIPCFYYPVDRRRYVQRAFAMINPEAVVLIEAELWPNFLWGLQRRNIPHFLVNARLSRRSYRGYRWFGFLFRPLFAGFAGVGAQTEADMARLSELGFRREAVRVVGSLKYDAAKLGERRMLDVDELLAQVGVGKDSPVVVAGSTHAGEEAMLAGVVRRLQPRFPGLFLVLVPRHMERGGDVGRELSAMGVRYYFRSDISNGTRRAPGEIECLVVNSTGELRFFYQRADVVFVGKSLTAEGGQNPIEPAALGKAVVFGPNMQNFAEIAAEFLKVGGAAEVRDAAGLERVLGELLGDPARRAAMGRAALQVVESRQGGIEKTVAMILDHLPVR